MITRVITTSEEFDNLRIPWEKIEDQDQDVTYYSTFNYIHTWWEEYKNDLDKELFIICVFQENDVVGIAPLLIKKNIKGFISWRELVFMGKGDYSGFLLDRKQNNEMTILKSIFENIEKYKLKWDRLNLTYIRGDSTLAHFIFRSQTYNRFFQLLVETPRLNFSNYESLNEIKKKFPSKINKLKNKLNNDIGYKFRVVRGINNQLYDKITEIHIKEQSFLVNQKNRKERRSLFENNKINSFRRNTVCNNQNTIAFLIETVNGKILSYNLAYLYKNTLYSWNSAYDPAFEKYRLAKIRYAEIFQYVFNQNLCQIFDFGAGRYPWKFEWTNEFLSVYQLQVWNSSSLKNRGLKKVQQFTKT